jgi:hypothetical protein
MCRAPSSRTVHPEMELRDVVTFLITTYSALRLVMAELRHLFG